MGSVLLVILFILCVYFIYDIIKTSYLIRKYKKMAEKDRKLKEKIEHEYKIFNIKYHNK